MLGQQQVDSGAEQMDRGPAILLLSSQNPPMHGAPEPLTCPMATVSLCLPEALARTSLPQRGLRGGPPPHHMPSCSKRSPCPVLSLLLLCVPGDGAFTPVITW